MHYSSFMDTKNTVESTIDRLRSDPGPMREIAEQSGLGRDWLNALKGGRIRDPGVLKIERLNDTLRKREKLNGKP